MMTPREIRQAAGWNQARVAVAANTSVSTVRVYEIRRDVVRADKRAALDAVYLGMAATLTPKAA